MTAVQLAAAMNTIANGGTYVAPRLVQATIGRDGAGGAGAGRASAARSCRRPAAERDEPDPARGGVPGHRASARRSTATRWPARPAPSYKARDQGGYVDASGRKKYYASFAGFVPAEKPRLTILVSIDEPPGSGEHYGGLVAAPLFVDVAREALRSLQVPPTAERRHLHGRARPAVTAGRRARRMTLATAGRSGHPTVPARIGGDGSATITGMILDSAPGPPRRPATAACGASRPTATTSRRTRSAAGAAAPARRPSLDLAARPGRRGRHPRGHRAAGRHALGPPLAAGMAVVGVTGTNGKTTTSYLLAAVLEQAGWPTGVSGTLTGVVHHPRGARAAGPAGRDWPTSGERAVAMEVSSHALALHRVDGTRFAVAVFTNLGRDHLDFHGTDRALLRGQGRACSRPSWASRGRRQRRRRRTAACSPTPRAIPITALLAGRRRGPRRSARPAAASAGGASSVDAAARRPVQRGQRPGRGHGGAGARHRRRRRSPPASARSAPVPGPHRGGRRRPALPRWWSTSPTRPTRLAGPAGRAARA